MCSLTSSLSSTHHWSLSSSLLNNLTDLTVTNPPILATFKLVKVQNGYLFLAPTSKDKDIGDVPISIECLESRSECIELSSPLLKARLFFIMRLYMPGSTILVNVPIPRAVTDWLSGSKSKLNL
eukprot:NODE_23_length_38171_cov_0.318108.p20 type:complete len:124 gc:universal NODE_23_length_38171_cov_0.318108:2009-2380(+)